MTYRIALAIVSLALWLQAEDVSYDYELDAYYSNVSAFFKVGDQNVTDATSYTEFQIYEELFLNTFKPNIFLIEFAVHPVPIAGLVYRKHNEERYEKAYIKELNVNPIQALTTGFEEPYSLSFFFGRMMTFKKEGVDHIGENRAYIGYLLTVGDYSIKDNRAIYDKWFNAEAKLKGTRNINKHNLDWSFRVGGRFHDNPDFTDSIYIGARRSRIDFEHSLMSWLYNSAFDVMIASEADRLELMQFRTVVEKKWPIDKVNKVSFGLGVGYEFDSNRKYSGELRDEGVINHKLIIRPNITF
jgi:hypothetical protein